MGYNFSYDDNGEMIPSDSTEDAPAPAPSAPQVQPEAPAPTSNWYDSIIDSLPTGIGDSVRDAFGLGASTPGDTPGREGPDRSAAAASVKKIGQTVEEPDNPDDSFFTKLKKGAGRAWEKDPGKVLEVGLGAIGGAYSAAERRKAAEAAAQGRLNEQNNADSLKQAETARYNASISTRARTAAAPRALTRIGGARVYNNGTLNKG